MDQAYTKRLYVLAGDHQKPKLTRWKLIVPEEATRNPLEVRFGEAMDAVLIRENLRIYNEEGAELAGKITLTDQEKGILFTPLDSWKKGSYVLQSALKVEDLSGNNLKTVFDRDISLVTQDTLALSKRTFTIQ